MLTFLGSTSRRPSSLNHQVLELYSTRAPHGGFLKTSVSAPGLPPGDLFISATREVIPPQRFWSRLLPAKTRVHLLGEFCPTDQNTTPATRFLTYRVTLGSSGLLVSKHGMPGVDDAKAVQGLFKAFLSSPSSVLGSMPRIAFLGNP